MDMRRIPSLMCLVLTALVLVGCAPAASGPKPTAKLEDVITNTAGSPGQREIQEINEKLFASLSSAPQPGEYVITAGDLVQVSVFETQELQKEARVGARGFITLPLLGPVQVMGRDGAGGGVGAVKGAGGFAPVDALGECLLVGDLRQRAGQRQPVSRGLLLVGEVLPGAHKAAVGGGFVAIRAGQVFQGGKGLKHGADLRRNPVGPGAAGRRGESVLRDLRPRQQELRPEPVPRQRRPDHYGPGHGSDVVEGGQPEGPELARCLSLVPGQESREVPRPQRLAAAGEQRLRRRRPMRRSPRPSPPRRPPRR